MSQVGRYRLLEWDTNCMRDMAKRSLDGNIVPIYDVSKDRVVGYALPYFAKHVAGMLNERGR